MNLVAMMKKAISMFFLVRSILSRRKSFCSNGFLSHKSVVFLELVMRYDMYEYAISIRHIESIGKPYYPPGICTWVPKYPGSRLPEMNGYPDARVPGDLRVPGSTVPHGKSTRDVMKGFFFGEIQGFQALWWGIPHRGHVNHRVTGHPGTRSCRVPGSKYPAGIKSYPYPSRQ